MSDRINKLKELWNNYNDSWNTEAEYNSFKEKYPLDTLENLKLEDYTNVKINETTEYFTLWLERKTENCGKFRTASSYAYGIYKVNINNIKDEKEREKAQGKYKAHDVNNKKSKDYIDEIKAKEYFENNINGLIIKLANYEDLENCRPLDINYARKIAYMYNVDKLIPIYKKDVIESVAEFFDIKNEIDFFSYKATEPILDKICSEFDIHRPIDIRKSQEIASFIWKNFGKSVSFSNKNMIYYGAPGTGKTFTVQNAIRQKVLIDGDDINEVALFTQFHPSIGYEDFIEGLKPHISNGATELKLTNGMFKKFCKKAMNSLKESRMKGEEPKSFYFVADEINRAELSTVFGELLLCIEENKRVDFTQSGEMKNSSMLIDTQYSYLIEKAEDAVIEENGYYKFGVPSNLYFIGTMNDIDRSIDSFDLALRRRFTWIRMDCNYDVIVNDEKLSKIENIDKYIDICKDLNNYISKILRLGKSYEIGHSYFMEVDFYGTQISKQAIVNLFDKKLKPLIEEYLRGEYSQVEIEEKIKEANKIFSL